MVEESPKEPCLRELSWIAKHLVTDGGDTVLSEFGIVTQRESNSDVVPWTSNSTLGMVWR
ncbi:hypothetical protein [Schlesneria paludicola]|uniref:hypothetical protein n=1 Tax=Schlesneria paludicola TaxID=360056 RepID=UPI00029AB232|nr:hypothetical protein [Schlesneria paludicola]